MKITHWAVGLTLTAATAAPAGCTSQNVPTGASPTPVTKTVTDWVVWGTGIPGESREPGQIQYSVYCRDHGAGWRQVQLPAVDKSSVYRNGSPCPDGPILGGSGCDQHGLPVNATDDTAAGEGAGICPQIEQAVTA